MVVVASIIYRKGNQATSSVMDPKILEGSRYSFGSGSGLKIIGSTVRPAFMIHKDVHDY
jgi:hypothetical protein